VSGLAKGIDAAAHTGALFAGGMTIGIVNTPIQQNIYPKENIPLSNRIKDSGCLIHPFDTLANESKENGLSHFSKRLLERDILLAHWCPMIISVSDNEIITGGTKWATGYGIKFGKVVYRCDSKMDYHINPKVEKSKIWWESEIGQILNEELLIERLKK
jgi:hypothetical protein